MLLEGFIEPTHVIPALAHRIKMSQQKLVPHLDILSKLVVGHLDVTKADGWCFKRVIWGRGLKIFYVDAMVAMRRAATEFIRTFVIRTYNPPLPSEFSSPPITTAQGRMAILVQADGTTPLNILYMSRGNSGQGRSLKDESIILHALKNAGARVFFCCNFDKMSLADQLGMAVHADVVMGLHGAGLTNAVFMRQGGIVVELKTKYAYASDIFARVADSRNGLFVHIDVRDYNRPGRQPNIADASLADRIVSGLDSALKSQRNGYVKPSAIVKLAEDREDYVIGAAKSDGGLGNILGPLASDLMAACRLHLAFGSYREEVLGADRDKFCAGCGT